MNFQSSLVSPFSLSNIFETRLNKIRNKSVDPSISAIYSNNPYDNCNFEKDKLRDELVKARVKYNQKHQDYHNLRIEFKRLEKDYQILVQLLDDLLSEANRKLMLELKDLVTLNDQDFDKKLLQHISHESSVKILNYNLIIKLKHDVCQLREEVKKKDNEIHALQSKSTILKYNNLDDRLAKTSLELMEVTDKYFRASQRENDIRNHAEGLIQKLDVYQNELNKTKNVLMDRTRNNERDREREKLKERLEVQQNYSREIDYNSEERKMKEKNLTILVNSYSKRLKTKDTELEAIKFENLRLEKMVYDIKEKAKNKKTRKKSKDNHMKNDLIIKEAKIKELEERTLEYFKEIEKLKKYKSAGKNLSKVERNYNAMKNENTILREDIEKLKNELLILKVYVKQDLDKKNDYDSDNDEHDDMKIKSKESERQKRDNQMNDMFLTRLILECPNSKIATGTLEKSQNDNNPQDQIEEREPFNDCTAIINSQIQNEELKRIINDESLKEKDDKKYGKSKEYVDKNNSHEKESKDNHIVKLSYEEPLENENKDKENSNALSEKKIDKEKEKETASEKTKEITMERPKEPRTDRESLRHLNNLNDHIIVNNINPPSFSRKGKRQIALYSNQNEELPISHRNSKNIEAFIDHPSNVPIDNDSIIIPSNHKVIIVSHVDPCPCIMKYNNQNKGNYSSKHTPEISEDNKDTQRSVQNRNTAVLFHKSYNDLSIEQDSLSINKTFTKNTKKSIIYKDKGKSAQEINLLQQEAEQKIKDDLIKDLNQDTKLASKVDEK